MTKVERPSRPDYGNWVSSRLIYLPAVIGLIFAGLAFLFPACSIITFLFFAISEYFAYARFNFSPKGGDVQTKVRELILANLNWDGKGKALDIGCGNGALTVMLAKNYEESHIDGIDF